jgi:hypothetical protein
MVSVLLSLVACTPEESAPETSSREDAIPADGIKMTPELDKLPPILHSDEYYEPVPLGSTVNTAGAEDSPFITPDGKTLYFVFVPDPNVPVEEQLLDGVAGIYVSLKEAAQWTEAERVILQDVGKLSLDGCQFILGNVMWFCTDREGNYRGVDIWTAEFVDGE